MSIIYCDKHDWRWDSECPKCENALDARKQKILTGYKRESLADAQPTPRTDDVLLSIANEAVREWLTPDYGCNDTEHAVATSLLRLQSELAAANAELQEWRTWGIIEVAVRNPNVAEYMRHWETRAELAEQRLATVEAERNAAEKALNYNLGIANHTTQHAMQERDAIIRQLRTRYSAIEIANLVGLTRQRVHQILNEAEAAAPKIASKLPSSHYDKCPVCELPTTAPTQAGAQEPVAILHDDGHWTWKGTPPYKSNFVGWRMDVYASPQAPREKERK